MRERGNVAIVSSRDECAKETLLLDRTRGRRPVAGDVLTRAGHDLPSVRFCKPKDARDVTVCIVEGLTKDVRGSLGRRQLLQEHPYATGQCLILFRSHPGIVAQVHWFRLPGPN